MIKRILKFVGAGLGMVLLVFAWLVLSDLTYWKRLATAPMDAAVTAVDWYSPLERISGAPLTADIPSAAMATISQTAVADAVAYGGETESIALLIYHQDALVLEHYWPGYGPGTRTDPASMHKTVMAMAIGVAVADGLIESVDVPAAVWLTEWQGDARADITVRDLLQMSSGLALVPFTPNPFGAYFRFLLGTDITTTILGVPAAGPPGNFAYSNINAQALGTVLQRAVGRRYGEYLDERLWSRLQAGPAYLWLDTDDGMARTFCCIQTTARGWLQVGRLIMGEGSIDGRQIVPAGWMRAMTTPSPANPNYGYQVWLGTEYVRDRVYNAGTSVTAFHSEAFAADDLIYLDGFGGQRVYVSPRLQLIIVRTGRARLDWDDARLPNTIVRGILNDGS